MLICVSSILHRAVLGQNGDAALFLEIVRVHDTFGNVLMCCKRARLTQHFVDQRGFAVIDVGNNRNVTNVVSHASLFDPSLVDQGPRPGRCVKKRRSLTHGRYG